MKHLGYLAFALVVACSVANAGREESGATASSGSGAAASTGATSTSGSGGGEIAGCIGDGDPFAVETLRDRVTLLASPDFAGRAPGTPGDLAARAHIRDRFACLGLSPGGDGGSFEQAFVNSQGAATANVVGLVAGSDPGLGSEIIVVGAHHDHLGVIGGKIHPGANDNASGVAGLLAIAQAVQLQPDRPRRSIAFVAFGAEETSTDYPYVEGSHLLVSDPPEALAIDQVVYMVNLDMIGSYEDEELVYAIGTLSGTPARGILETLTPSHPTIDVDLGEPGEVGDSDFYPFCQAGIPYAYFWTDDYHCYHAPCDTADGLDYAPMASIVRLAYQLVAELAGSGVDLAAFRDQVGCQVP